MINQGMCFFGQSHTCNKKRWRLWFPDFWSLHHCFVHILLRTLVRAGMQGGGGTGVATIPESQSRHRLLEMRKSSLRLGTGRQLLETQPDSAHAWCTWNV